MDTGIIFPEVLSLWLEDERDGEMKPSTQVPGGTEGGHVEKNETDLDAFRPHALSHPPKVGPTIECTSLRGEALEDEGRSDADATDTRDRLSGCGDLEAGGGSQSGDLKYNISNNYLKRRELEFERRKCSYDFEMMKMKDRSALLGPSAESIR
ncbi:uncharacterized protein A4U43_C01F1360 [Asparagus officinalis]|uniref:Uncharacterized protein n=1 Tax=Asparagus officinalis TaxID=4686 RepID=A0A5P1FLD7_ASPOF|nr:uncharacterized protein A4U43_C01F1360 [Asparagus officinalis]